MIQMIEGGWGLDFDGKHHVVERITAALFLGNDTNPEAYIVAGCQIPQVYRKLEDGEEHLIRDPEYHIFGEKMGRLSEDFITDVKQFIDSNRVERVLVICSDVELRNRVRKRCGFRPIWIEEKKRSNLSVIMREWFARRKPNGDVALRIWKGCGEATRLNYPPARDCIVRMLEFFDARKNAKITPPKSKLTRGYH